MKRVTVIVPVYNVEKYLERCLDSLLAQTYENVSVLVVNDGSTDGSQKIIDAYKERYPEKFICYEKENTGIATTRNFGIDHVESELMMFVDSDDYVEKDMVETCVTLMEKEDSDVVVFSYLQEYLSDGSSEVIHNRIPDGTYTLKDTPSLLALSSNSCWGKLYKTEVFRKNHIRFPDGLIYEDLGTTPKVLYYAGKISYLDKPMYRYQVGVPGQIMSRIHDDDVITIGERLVQFFKERNEFDTYYDELYYITYLNITDILRAAMMQNNRDFAYKLIDRANDYREKYFPKPLNRYSLVSDKRDRIYLNRSLSKLYYRMKHWK